MAAYPDLVHLEGSFGSILLEKDITIEDWVFGRGGKANLLPGFGLGMNINTDHLQKLTVKKKIIKE